MSFKHLDRSGYELCSGRPGWPNRKTNKHAEVTCKNCLKRLAAEGYVVRPVQHFIGHADIRATLAHHCTRGGADSRERYNAAAHTIDTGNVRGFI
jgi:hypothetical protein